MRHELNALLVLIILTLSREVLLRLLLAQENFVLILRDVRVRSRWNCEWRVRRDVLSFEGAIARVRHQMHSVPVCEVSRVNLLVLPQVVVLALVAVVKRVLVLLVVSGVLVGSCDGLVLFWSQRLLTAFVVERLEHNLPLLGSLAISVESLLWPCCWVLLLEEWHTSLTVGHVLHLVADVPRTS